jgi:hypothetical protein
MPKPRLSQACNVCGEGYYGLGLCRAHYFQQYQRARRAIPELRLREQALNTVARRKPERLLKARLVQRARMVGCSTALVVALQVVQGPACAICTRRFDESHNHTRECLDHCHATGAVRGMLCGACNLGLGAYEDFQRPAGLVIPAYDAYLAAPPAAQLR